MRKNRCWHDIVESILNALLEGGKGITELCLLAKIPVDRGKKIINHLTKYGLIIIYEVNNRKYYRITGRGYEWLGTYKHLKLLLPC